MSMTSVAQPVAVVTGASQGIGEGLVRAFRDRGYRIVATSRSIKPGADPDVVAVPGDVAAPDTAASVFEAALTRFGRVDTLVNNAGVFIAKPFGAYSLADYDRTVATNVTGFFHMTQRAIEIMERQGRGHIVSITTSVANQPMTSVPSVLASLSKGGLNAATRSLALEFADRGIRVNAVSPGVIKTPMHPPETHPFFAALHPMGRMGEISEIVYAVLYLETASFVTGQVLHVDGGQTAGQHAVRGQ